MQDTTTKQLLHDIWLILTFASILGWTAYLLMMWSQLARLLKKVWPKLYRVFQLAGLAIFGVIVEISSAEIAAFFYQPAIIYDENLYVRLAGRGFEALTIWTALIITALIKLKNGE